MACSSQHNLEHLASRLATLADAAASVQATAEQATQAAQQTAASGNQGGFFGPIAKAFEVSLAVSAGPALMHAATMRAGRMY